MAGPTRVEAELFIREMKAGRNHAVLVLARGADGVAVECVVKFKKAMAPEHAAMLPIPYLLRMARGSHRPRARGARSGAA